MAERSLEKVGKQINKVNGNEDEDEDESHERPGNSTYVTLYPISHKGCKNKMNKYAVTNRAINPVQDGLSIIGLF